MPKVFNSIYVQTPLGLQRQFPQKEIPLSVLYGNGFFISEVFGTEAWIIDAKTFESQTKYLVSPLTKGAYTSIKKYARKQYKRFCYLVDNHIRCFAD